MKFFPVMVISLLVLVGVMWARLDGSGGRSAGQSPVCVPPYELYWLPWKPGLVESMRKDGKVVWLTFASDWDLTGAVNEKRVFLNQAVQDKLARHRVVLIKADLTQYDPEIREELMKYRKTPVIPTNLVFPANQEGVMILPELISPEIALGFLERAVGL